MDVDLEVIAGLDSYAKRILESNIDAQMSGFMEERSRLLEKYLNQIEWYRHIGIKPMELVEVCESLKKSKADNIIVIVITEEETHINTYLFVEESLQNYIGTYTEVD